VRVGNKDGCVDVPHLTKFDVGWVLHWRGLTFGSCVMCLCDRCPWSDIAGLIGTVRSGRAAFMSINDKMHQTMLTSLW